VYTQDFGIWDPNDRTVKVGTYLKSPTFSASNGKCYNSLSSFRIFECILRVWVIKRTQKLHENSGDIFEKVRIVCVECNKLDSLLDYRIKRNKFDSWVVTIDNFYVCIKTILPKLHSNVPLSYPFSRTSKFYEWLRIKFYKCNMVIKCNMAVIALEFVSRSHALIYVLASLARVDQVVAWIRQSYLE